MQMATRRLIAALTAVLTLGCGGSSTGPSGGGGGGGGTSAMAAQIDGQSWTADPATAGAQAVAGVPGGYVIIGTQVFSSTNARTVSLSLYNIGGPGTYALGVLPMVIGGIATIGESNAAWLTPLDGLAGTVTITTLSATRIAGTFAFTANPGAGTAGGARTVTAGHFDLPLKGTVTPLTESSGSRVTATINGAPYNASTVAITMKGAGGLGFTSIGGDSTLTVYLTGVTSTGSFTVGTTPALVDIVVTGAAAAGHPSWGATATDAGSITVTSLTAGRAKGTFNVTIAPGAGNGGGPLTVTGDFDVGIQ
jgi:S-layer protein